ncbi:hypothetical protein AFC81_08985 [Mycobacterium avium subsp. paratuberculosis]|nr:hypothetical protein RC58_16960 [Mycobacterium avium subsp. paratuberculosis]ETA98258.1 hypothetical protein O979_18615 [Mycobacterium avium subsp. paratuberculosis 10-4404]ETB01302.1 hypothetical protein O978_18505 [Mycobacterium avium subsp. paratuberculosis 10-5864]ETB09688.1 hypothetical protein O980_18080 [Mycobacterium avium subsp. paratuberculosis 08-8281]ETB29626.1 hypothetical protein O977_18005 [Mycobacterium avium subsp. paratuberculosis 10-5975]ETB36284.1 hypothetical protein O9
MTPAADGSASVTLGNRRSLLLTEDAAPRLCRSWRSPLSTTAATRCAPALPELAIAASGSLDFSSCVYIGEGPAQ